MKNVLILNGAPKRNGNTAALIGAFSEGAESAGHRVRAFYLNGMDIRGCLDCRRGQGAWRTPVGINRRSSVGRLLPPHAGASIPLYSI